MRFPKRCGERFRLRRFSVLASSTILAGLGGLAFIGTTEAVLAACIVNGRSSQSGEVITLQSDRAEVNCTGNTDGRAYLGSGATGFEATILPGATPTAPRSTTLTPAQPALNFGGTGVLVVSRTAQVFATLPKQDAVVDRSGIYIENAGTIEARNGKAINGNSADTMTLRNSGSIVARVDGSNSDAVSTVAIGANATVVSSGSIKISVSDTFVREALVDLPPVWWTPE